MKPISSAQRETILVLHSSDSSAHQVASKTGLGKSTVARALKKALPYKENIKLGHPSKLIPTDKRAIVHHIISGRADNAVQAAQFINSIIINPVSPQTIRNTLKSAQLKAVVKKKKPLLSATHRKRRLAFALKY